MPLKITLPNGNPKIVPGLGLLTPSVIKQHKSTSVYYTQPQAGFTYFLKEGLHRTSNTQMFSKIISVFGKFWLTK